MPTIFQNVYIQMKQRFILFALFAVVAASVLSSCSSSATYAEELKSEKASIQDFIKDKGYTITSVKPKTVPYPDGVFFEDSTGLYVHVIDTGSCIIDSIPTNTPIEVRYLETDMDGDTTYTNMYSSTTPIEIFYNNVTSTSSYWGDCQAWHAALRYVGDRGHVELIVPASLGMSYYTTSSALVACYYELRYTFWK